MIDYKKLLELKKLGVSNNSIAKKLGCKWDTVTRVISRCNTVWGDWEEVPSDLTSEQILDRIYSDTRFHMDEEYLQPDSEMVLDQQRKGKRRNDLWVAYAAEAAKRGKKAYKITRFNEIVTEFQTSNDISFSVDHEPGVEGQVDWAGDKGMIIDPRTGETADVYVFVSSLPYSGYFYAEGFLDMKMASWIEGNRNAFSFFGGVPAILTPDNCATAVDIKKGSWEDAILNTQFCAFAEHYGTLLKPTRVRAPRDKAVAERSVGIVERDILPSMNEMEIYSIEEFNRILWKKVNASLGKKFTKKSFSRKAIFWEEEQAKLLPLPACEFELYAEKTAVVGRDFHIQFDSAFYSVPVQYIKSKVTVRSTAGTVRIFNDKKALIAEHARATHKWQRCTDSDHIPTGHAPTMAYNRDAFVRKASGYGDDLVKWVESVLGRFEFEVQGYRTVNTVLCSVGNYHPDSVLNAARLSNSTGVYSTKGFLLCCKQFEAKRVASVSDEAQPNLNDLFCSHSSRKEETK